MKSGWLRRAADSLKLTAVVAVFIASPPAAGSGQSLFADDEIFDLTVHAPLARLTRDVAGAGDVTGSLQLADGTSIPMRCRKYGISRLEVCDLASLEMAVEAEDVLNTPFEGRRRLRVVAPCRLGGSFDRYTVLEYLVYKSYAEITQPALGVRLVRARFVDSEKPSRSETAYAFFIEDIGRAAERNGRVWLDIDSQAFEDLDPAQLTLMTLFQYMVGNTDWSAVRGRPDDRCCHNVAVFGEKNGGSNVVVPFDFDQAGLVDPPYAAPDASLGIRHVTERKYRGLCAHNAELAAAISVFNQRRPRVETLFTRDSLPYSKSRQRALRYIDGFYETINDPRKLEKKVIRDCR